MNFGTFDTFVHVKKCGFNLLWNMDSFNHLCREHSLFTIHKVFEEVNRHVVVGREVHANIGREEVVDLSLAAVLGCKLL